MKQNREMSFFLNTVFFCLVADCSENNKILEKILLIIDNFKLILNLNTKCIRVKHIHKNSLTKKN